MSLARLLLFLFLAAALVVPGASGAGEQPEAALDWEITCVDCPRWFRDLTDRSLRLDPAGRPHIVYGGEHLFLAWRDGETWRYETVDDTLGAGFFPALAFDAANGNYHLTASDPGIDRGVETDLMVDFDGNARNQDGNGDGVSQPDPGAFEKPYPANRWYFPWVAIRQLGTSPYNNPAALLYSSYIPWPAESVAEAYRFDRLGRLWIVGTTTSASFPTTDGAFDRTFEGESEAFVLRFSADGTHIEYATFLGASRTDYG